MSFVDEDVVMSHQAWSQRHPGDVGYQACLGFPADCTGRLKREDDLGTLRCDGCGFAVVIRSQHPVRADQYVPKADRDGQAPF